MKKNILARDLEEKSREIAKHSLKQYKVKRNTTPAVSYEKHVGAPHKR